MQGLEKVLGTRFARQFGIGIPDSEYPPNFMVPRFTDGRPAREPISPNRFFSEEKTELSIDGVKLEVYMIRTNVCQSNNDTSRGVRLEVYMIPGERADHVAVWLPDSQVLFAGDHVYGSFPNLYPIRGSVYRDVERWARGVRRLVAFAPKAVMFGYNHVPAWEEYLPMTENYARVIESVYEQTIQGMNEGRTADELATSVRLPEALRNLPCLGDIYGVIPGAAREIFAAKIG